MIIDNALLKYDEESVFKLRSLYRDFGYSRYKMSKFEEYDLYVKNKDFLISDSVITFTDTRGKLLALKPDVTLSIINNCKDVEGQVQKVYYDEKVYRVSGSSHNYKEIMQTGLECIGDIGLYDICEVLLLAIRSLNIIDDDYVLSVSHIGLLKSILDDLSIEDGKKETIINLICAKNSDDLALVCKDFGYSDKTFEVLNTFTNSFSSFNQAIEAFGNFEKGEESQKAYDEFKNILNVISNRGFEEKTVIDFSSVDGMKYYSGIVFKGYINGIPESVCSGGQYDKLMRKMGRTSSAIGFAVYLDALERFKEHENEFDVDVVLLENDSIDAVFDAVKKLSDDGQTVRVCKNVPDNIRFKRVVKLSGKELVTVCEND